MIDINIILLKIMLSFVKYGGYDNYYSIKNKNNNDFL